MTETRRTFQIKILGRLLEHLGVQMYKHRDAAIAELVANAWDAGATDVWITLPSVENYDPLSSEIIIEDNGCGMGEDDLQDKYLVIGRNRRTAEHTEEFRGRKVMGRKGIGKLAGFGIATRMTVETWIQNKSIEITLDLKELKNDPVTETTDDVMKSLEGIIRDSKPQGIHANSATGTRIKLTVLKQKQSLDASLLNISLARRFSRTVRGHMNIFINDLPLTPLVLDLHKNSPTLDSDLITDTLKDGNAVKYRYSYSSNPITRDKTLQGWTILVNGKTAQAPPFFFDLDTDGKSQHSSKYLIGEIEADFLDIGQSDEGDLVATDRQEIDWDREETNSLWEWGRKITQKIFDEIGARNADMSINVVLENAILIGRIDALDPISKKQCLQIIGTIGNIKVENDEMPGREKILQLADQIIKAYEYRQFIDVIDEIEEASKDPHNLEMLLSHLEKWEILESRSILEVVKGRIVIVDKLHTLIVNDAPETANRRIGADNMHDLIAGFPWLLNPEWQILDEEKTITKQLREWGAEDIKDADSYKRYDFLGMEGNGKTVIIEIKRTDHPINLEELQRIDTYKNRLSKAHPDITCVLLFGGKHNVEEGIFKSYLSRPDFKILTWEDVYQKNYSYYNHYRAVLEGHITHPDFARHKEEVKNIKKVIATGTAHRTKEDRELGLGPQDLNNPPK